MHLSLKVGIKRAMLTIKTWKNYNTNVELANSPTASLASHIQWRRVLTLWQLLLTCLQQTSPERGFKHTPELHWRTADRKTGAVLEDFRSEAALLERKAMTAAKEDSWQGSRCKNASTNFRLRILVRWPVFMRWHEHKVALSPPDLFGV